MNHLGAPVHDHLQAQGFHFTHFAQAVKLIPEIVTDGFELSEEEQDWFNAFVSAIGDTNRAVRIALYSVFNMVRPPMANVSNK